MQTTNRKEKADSIFTSKSNVLKFLQNKISNSKIETIFYFTVEKWEKNEENILKQIIKVFQNQKVIVRSSAIGEDSEENSYAGSYESVLDVNTKSKTELKNGIISVINSYKNKGNRNLQNQILIQSQTRNIITSGVIFTKTTDLGAPYYVINYDESTSTTGVTHGSINNVIKIARNINNNRLPKKWKLLIKATKEIEDILETNLLDIEFGITKDFVVVIFQVRPITSISKSQKNLLDNKITKAISKNKKKFINLSKKNKILGQPLIFSDMTDWNPAEIIGNNPSPLDYSLYDFLIMKYAWYKGRTNMGYRSFTPHSLMVKFGNKPYVDVRTSFNSLIPSNIDDRLSKKLVNYYLQKLSQNPQLHDKVEFDILFSSYNLSLRKKLKDLIYFGFSKREIQKIYESILQFTKIIIKDFSKTSRNCKLAINKMTQNRDSIRKKTSTLNSHYKNNLEAAEFLLKDCRDLGTIPFSTMARIAFISTAFLKSLVTEGHILSLFFDNFMNLLETPLSKFQHDLIKYYNNEISKDQFLKKYGHLRPGTYDITVDRYDKDNLFLNDVKFKVLQPAIIKRNDSKIEKILKENDFDIKSEDFFSFVKESLVLREELKFEFTHNLSDALELIAKAGGELGFFREDIAYLEIGTILNTYKKFSRSKLKFIWQEKIKQNKKESQINNFLVLSPLIMSKDDFEIIKYHMAKPNYITEKSISGNILHLTNLKQKLDFENKIVLLENADPGFDWIFTRNPLGLITKYGGVASHMSIRCSEISLPAAIGCGEIIYEKLKDASKVMLDCKNHQIVILEQKKHDEFVEQKKILKSLGYIK